MRAVVPLLLGLVLLAGAAAAAPETSLRPKPRPFATMPMPVGAPVALTPPGELAPAQQGTAPATAAQPPAPTVVANPSGSIERPSLRPQLRPVRQVAAAPAPDQSTPPEVTMAAPPAALAPAEPPPRRGLARLFGPRKETAEPRVLAGAAIRPNPGKEAAISRKGAVCGDPAIKGVTLAPIPGKLRGCGIAEPVQVTSVDGVALSMAATLDCTTARALKTWVQTGLKPAFGRDKVAGLQIAAHYACRSQNNRKGAPISEHGRGKAIDISGIILTDGNTLTIEGDWRRRNGRAIKQAYKAGCGIFGTTLGPGSDGYHEDHMHFDTASHRNGSYCR
ncbi:extensin family protein [Fertoebacter nigrum]|uniref:Extensin family protein n=1 Tax=Fertoeibacter niger TaxID=2656921 RepID=A0A8X8H015_9RHOB|nr:extensin family protein [Fertoeibacter niger]NUB44440.1 extensin family protein [Fertoeibacter niger]